MKNKLICFCLTIFITLVSFPSFVFADGMVIGPLPEGDWMQVDESRQQAFINYEDGIEKLIVAVEIEKKNQDIVWILPVPSKPEQVEVDITSKLPIFFGDEVTSKAKQVVFNELLYSYSGALLSQVWTFPLTIIFASLRTGGPGGSSEKISSGDLVAIETHIEKAGMVAEVITAKDGQAIYNYFSQKGFHIKPGAIPKLNSYIEKEYSFVVAWITSEAINKENKEQRGIFISFPTSKIYYPLVLTSIYGELEIPITIRVLDHVKPAIFSEIESYTEVSYFTKRPKGYGVARKVLCISDMAQLRTIMVLFYDDHNRYPFSLQELKEDKELGGEVKELLQDINNVCHSYPSYILTSEGGYIITLPLPGEIYKIDSSGFAGFIDEEETVPLELQKFYGNKKPWKGEAEYTKITINAPAKLLEKDLWMEQGRPFKISFALWVINSPLIVSLLSYLLIVSIISFFAGGLTGLWKYGKFKKYALIGMSNVFTLLGLILVLHYINKKEETTKRSLPSFAFLFSIIFLLLLILPLLVLILWGDKDLWFLPITIIIGIGIGGGILLFVHFLLRRTRIKNELTRFILTIIIYSLVIVILISLIGLHL